ncbi:MAG: BrnT family toxin [Planctomycetaceae bacterium]|nr:BrnT family toxin [Planctomycetaceae bacterium]
MLEILWDLDDDAEGNVQHCARHDVTPEEIEYVLDHFLQNTVVSESSQRWVTFGHTITGRYLAVVWEEIEPSVAYPITAYDAPEPS